MVDCSNEKKAVVSLSLLVWFWIVLTSYRALLSCGSGSGPKHIKVMAEWDQETRVR